MTDDAFVGCCMIIVLVCCLCWFVVVVIDIGCLCVSLFWFVVDLCFFDVWV